MVQKESKPYQNENLFSTHYLDERIEEMEEWSEEEKVEETYEKIKSLYEDKKNRIKTYTGEEGDLENKFIRPILDYLGYSYGAQRTEKETGKIPDYGFFKNEKDIIEAEKGPDNYYDKAIALGEAKYWGRDLDKEFGEDSYFTHRNPSFQIDHYLRTTKVKWGILTNGVKWRLYVDDADKIETYYEVNLVNILDQEDFDAFKYFYLFFRKQAFLPVGDSFLRKVRENSEKFDEEIGESLESDLYNSLLWLAKGYFDNSESNNLDITDEEDVKKVHDKSLIFLYRLLFLFYAYSEGMLDEDIPRKYRKDYSFSKWLERVLDEIDDDLVNPFETLHHIRLKRIFELVREGSESIERISDDEFSFPAYDGRLFSNEEHEFFEDKSIRDKYLAKVVDLLARRETEDGEKQVRIDYSSLGVKHLGGIYEGLLEYELKSADEKKVAVEEGSTSKWVSVSEVEKDFSEFDEEKKVEKNQLYLVTDKKERKVTGSYYTPKNVVSYIVDNTLEPAIGEKLSDAESKEEKRKKILSTNVLDPAMGSGHFLVEAIDYLARRLNEFSRKGESEKDLRRKVARNCIYGVDVNPLATELAKVSIWLHIMAKDKPLSFLDHHLKTGNSLVGADLNDLEQHPTEEKYNRSGLYGKSFQQNIMELIEILQDIQGVEEDGPDDIRRQKKLLDKFESHSFKKKFDVLADVQTSYYFGNEFSKKQYSRLLDVFRVEDLDDKVWENLSQTDRVRKASNISDEKDFFHWKLEFPKVFFNIEKETEEGNLGFDAVIGNPPWITMKGKQKMDVSENEVKYYNENYYSSEYKINSFALFIELSSKLAKEEGFIGYITPNTILRNEYLGNIREILLDNTLVEVIESGGEVFDDAIADTCILIFKNGKTEDNETDIIIDVENFKEKKYTKRTFPQELFSKNDNYRINTRFSQEELDLLQKVEKNSIKFKETGLDNYVGIVTGNKTDYISKKKKNDKWKKIIFGEDMEDFFFKFGSKYVLFDKDKLHSNTNENIFEQSEKVLLRKTGIDLTACYDDEQFYTEQSVYNIYKKEESQINLRYLTGLLNSTILQYYFLKKLVTNPESYPYIKGTDISRMPILLPDNETQKDIAKICDKISKLKESKNEEIEGFTDWLTREFEGVHKDKVRKNRYWEKDFGNFLSFLKDNSSENLELRKKQERIEVEFENSKPVVKDIEEKIVNSKAEIELKLLNCCDIGHLEWKKIADFLDLSSELRESLLNKVNSKN